MALSMGKKILLSLLLVSLLPVMLAGFIAYRVTERSMRKEVIAGLSALSESTFEHFVDYVDQKKDLVNLLSHDPAIMPALAGYEWAFNKDRLEAQEAYSDLDAEYRSFLEYYTSSGFSDLYLINKAGDIVYSLSRSEMIGENIERGAFKDTELAGVFKRAKVSSGIEISEFKIFTTTGEPAAFIAAPLKLSGMVQGFIAFKMDTVGLYKHVKDYTGLGETGEIVLAALDGQDIVFVAPLRHDPDAAFKRRVRIGSMEAMPMQRALNKEAGAGISIDYRGKKTVAVWRHFAPLRLGFVVKQDADEAFSSIDDLRRWMLIVAGITLIFVIIISTLAMRSIVRPIKALHEGVERVGAGDLSYRVGTLSGDEIGQLSRAFDEMTLNLKRITASRDDLDNEIAERKEAEQKLLISEERLMEYSKNLETMVDKRTTAIKALQKKLIFKEKLAAIGQLSSSVGHELRNPLGVIGNSVYYLNMKLKNGDAIVEKHLGILSREVRRTNKIISDLLDFSRDRALELQLGQINGLIRETLSAMEIADNITVDLDGIGELPEFYFDGDQVHQLMVNLITNALQAMPGGGLLCMKTWVNDGVAEISFEDSGQGIAAEDFKRVFDPLYTTKVRGTGLGLSIVKGIVERHGGRITLKSNAGEGTVVTVGLPLLRKRG